MKPNDRNKSAAKFAARRKDRGDENGGSNLFRMDLRTLVFGVDNIAECIRFEDRVHLDRTGFIDGCINCILPILFYVLFAIP